jgi:hypothetical protein
MKLFVVLLVLSTSIFADEGIDSKIDKFGSKDRIVLCIPTLQIKKNMYSLRRRIKEYDVKDFVAGQSFTITEVPVPPLEGTSKKYIIVQNGNIVDFRDVLIQLSRYHSLSDYVIPVYLDIKSARKAWVGSGVFAGFTALTIIPYLIGQVAFRELIWSRLNESVNKWKALEERYNDLVAKNDLGEPSTTLNQFIVDYIE